VVEFGESAVKQLKKKNFLSGGFMVPWPLNL
jgi:hypothetical protein